MKCPYCKNKTKQEIFLCECCGGLFQTLSKGYKVKEDKVK